MGCVNADQSEEFFVVSETYAIIEPETVMIEVFDTLVTLTAMLRRKVNPLDTDFAIEHFLTLVTFSLILIHRLLL